MPSLLSRLGIPPRLQAELVGLSSTTLVTLFSLRSPAVNALLTMSGIAVDKIGPYDSNINHEYFEHNGYRWHYADIKPTKPYKGTIFLIHGFPDIWFAWRYQVPLLLSLGFRCIIPDCMGYGGSDAPEDLKAYTFKAHSDAFAALARKLGLNKIILGGHDWGGVVVYRFAQYYPDLISHVFSVATPYLKIFDKYVSEEELIAGPLPNFAYQLQFGSKDHVVEKAFDTKPKLDKFLRAMYGGQVPSEANIFSPFSGVNINAVLNEKVSNSPLFSPAELDYYVDQFSIHGLLGPTNWYRVRKVNFEEERKIPEPAKSTIKQPTLFIACAKDDVLLPEMSIGMEENIPNLSRATVPASHWALWHTPYETNAAIRNWFEGVVLGGKSKL